MNKTYAETLAQEIEWSNRIMDVYARLRRTWGVLAELGSTFQVAPHWSDVNHVLFSTGSGDDVDATVTLALKEDAKDSPLVRELAQALGCKFEKQRHYSGKSLQAVATVGRVSIVVTGYLPGTCKLVATTETVPASTYTRYRVECDDAA